MVASLNAPLTPCRDAVAADARRAAMRCLRRSDVAALRAAAPAMQLDALRPQLGRTCRPTTTCKDGGHYRQPAPFLLRRRRRRAVAGAAPRALAAAGIQRAARRHAALVRADRRPRSSRSRPGAQLLRALGRAVRELKGAHRAGTSRRTSSASTPPTASAGRRRKARTATASTSSPCSWSAAQGIKGGETRVFEADGPDGQRFTLTEPWSLLLLDDARVIHESHADPAARATAGTATRWC